MITCNDCIVAYTEDNGLILRGDMFRLLTLHSAVKGKLNSIGLESDYYNITLFNYCPICGRGIEK